jgi:hypothetical protein
MKTILSHTVLAAMLSLVAQTAHAAGTVDVVFVEPEKYADIGRSNRDREHAMDVLQGHLKALGARLADGQTLMIEVLDVDLAGELKLQRRGDAQRVLKGRADWPRMSIRYTLSAGDQTLKSGEDKLVDMAYLQHGGRLPDTRALAYDLRMVDDWFGKTFAAAR